MCQRSSTLPQKRTKSRDRSGYLAEDTIAAIATAMGGPISIVRISGPQAFDVYSLLSQKRVLPAARTLARFSIADPQGNPLDDALAVRFVKPESFTGEDVVELHLHGSPYIATRIMEILNSGGIRQALPGEFSFRAVRNGKMSLPQAQAVADLISAANEGAVSLALEKMAGSQNRILVELAESLRKLAVLGEIGIDFADQDVEEVGLPKLKERLASILTQLQILKNSFDRGSKLQEGIRVAFIGLPNAGKSSFFNSILGEDRSIVSEIPGTTRDVVREKITLRGEKHMVTLRLEDTAGLRSSHDRIEQMGIERTLKAASEADLLLFLVDSSQLKDPGIQSALGIWEQMNRPAHKTIGILTKSDLLTPLDLSALQPKTESFAISKWVSVSALTHDGIHQAIQVITETGSQLTSREKGEILLTRLDQVEAIEEAILSLTRASSVPDLDLFASDIRQALNSLSGMIGETIADDILGKIFSDFCIGK